MKHFKKLFVALVMLFSVFGLYSFTKVEAAEVKKESNVSSSTIVADNSWQLVLDNIDMEVQYLEPNKYLGLFWDSYVNGKSTDGYLYLCWTSPYYSNTSNTILQFTESGTKYNLYSTIDDMNNGKGNWLSSSYKQYPGYNLNLYMTPIGGIKDGQNFGIKLKRTYNFTNVKFGYEGTNRVIGQISEPITFDLGNVPENNGKNAMQLCTHGYEIIKECEAQSYFDLFAYGGYGHFVYFNTTISIDKIYRVDVSYKILNDDKPWYQFFLPDDEHQITKSLTTERVSGGIFGLYKFQGFEEGSFQSTKDSATNYKYKLHLNYDDDAWNIFEGKEFYEADYRRISKFRILRLNYMVDGKVYDVPIKMDTIEGDTLFILDPDLILDTDSAYYQFKNAIDDFFTGVVNKWQQYKTAILIAAGCVGGIILIVIILKFKFFLTRLFGSQSYDDSGGKNNKK
ncbi:MAG: hypothetical protein K6G28_01745 [Acholeplasmatales bacterium]|nr:hypothetical protein [Acholeplasmatales bacterium]